MHSLKLTRCYLNYRAFNRLTNLISSGVFSTAFSTESASNDHKSREEPKGSEDIFGTLSTKTEEQKISKWQRSFGKHSHYYRHKFTNSNRESNDLSARSNHDEQEDALGKTLVSKPPRWKKTAGEGRYRNPKKIPYKNAGLETQPDDSSDKFGSLFPKTRSDPDTFQGDEGDALDEIKKETQKPVYNKSPRSYGNDMRQLIQQKKLGEALNLLKKMREIDMVKPDEYVYANLIIGCGQSGYTSMAFKLHTEMKEHGIKMPNVIYTGLFNSCGNCPFPEYGLKQARLLFNRISDKQIALNDRNYHAAIKAFGRCGDLQMAFRLVDEMIEKELTVTTETFNFLLMGCASDRKSGFLQAIRVWRKMQDKRLRPDVYSYNLLFRITRDCKLGEMALAERILLDTFNPDLNVESSNLNIKYLTDAKTSNLPLPVTSQSVVIQSPDVLSVQPQTSNVTQLIEPKTPQERFALLGGLANILKRMHQDEARPTLKTFTELLELIPCDNAVEDDFLKIMYLAKVKPDVDFYNVLIKKKNVRGDFKAAKEVLQLIGKDNLYPDIATFGTLAIGCKNLQHAQTFLNDLKEAGFGLNIQIMGALVNQGCYHQNFQYIIEMLKIIRKERIKPSTRLIDMLEKRVNATNIYLVKQEKAGIRFPPDDPFIQSFESFLKFYKPWLKSTKLEMKDDPWASYRPLKENNEQVEK